MVENIYSLLQKTLQNLTMVKNGTKVGEDAVKDIFTVAS